MLFSASIYLLLSAFINPIGTASETADARGVRPLPRQFREFHPFDPWQSAGVFVGISEFPKDGKLANIPFAVDNAVDLAHLFSLELGLIPPDRIRLLLSGHPRKLDSKKRLDALEAKGARVSGGSTTELEHSSPMEPSATPCS